jgi:hypothetical protein
MERQRVERHGRASDSMEAGATAGPLLAVHRLASKWRHSFRCSALKHLEFVSREPRGARWWWLGSPFPRKTQMQGKRASARGAGAGAGACCCRGGRLIAAKYWVIAVGLSSSSQRTRVTRTSASEYPASTHRTSSHINTKAQDPRPKIKDQRSKTQAPGGLSSIPWGARWALDPPAFASAIKCHQKSTSNSAGSSVGSLAPPRATPDPAAGRGCWGVYVSCQYFPCSFVLALRDLGLRLGVKAPLPLRASSRGVPTGGPPNALSV